jgi:hypothetical protein
MTISPLSHSLDLLQLRLDCIERTLARIQQRLQTLPLPDPVPFPTPLIDREKQTNKLYCSFCGKSQDEVARLIAGPAIFICDECVELCLLIIKGKSEEDHHAY